MGTYLGERERANLARRLVFLAEQPPVPMASCIIVSVPSQVLPRSWRVMRPLRAGIAKCAVIPVISCPGARRG